MKILKLAMGICALGSLTGAFAQNVPSYATNDPNILALLKAPAKARTKATPAGLLPKYIPFRGGPGASVPQRTQKVPAGPDAIRNYGREEDMEAMGGENAGFDENPDILRARWEHRLPTDQYQKLSEAWAAAPDESTVKTNSMPTPGFAGKWTQIGAGINNTAPYYRAGRISQAGYYGDTTQNLTGSLWCSGSAGGVWKALFLGFFAIMVPVSDSLPGSPSVGAFAVSPTNSNYVLVATGDAARYGGTGIYLTTNQGGSWTKCTLPSGNPTVAYRMVQDWSDSTGNTVLFATDAGVYRTTDFGQTWSRTYTGQTTDIIQDPVTSYIMYIGIQGVGVYRSRSWGTSWESEIVGLSGSINRVNVAVGKQAPNYVYCSIEGSGSGLNGVYRSSYYAENWTKIQAVDNISYGQAFHTGALSVDPANSNHVISAMGGCEQSYNAATAATPTWSGFDGGHADYRMITWQPNTNTAIFCNDGGIYSYDFTGGTLSGSLNTLGLNCEQNMMPANSLAVARGDATRLLCGLQDNGMVRINTAGSPYIQELGGGDGGSASISPDNTSLFAYTSGYAYGRYYSTDAGGTWNDVTSGFPGGFITRSCWAPVIVVDQSPGYGNHLYTQNNGYVYYKGTDPLGTSAWSAINSTSPMPITAKQAEPVTNPNLYGWYVSGVSTNKMYWVTTSALGTAGSIADRTPAGVGGADALVDADKSSAEPNTVYYCSAYNGTQSAFVSYDNGVNWTNVKGDAGTIAPGAYFWHLAANPANHSNLFLATSVGILRSDDGGVNWYKWMNGLPAQCDVENMVISYDNQATPKIRISTYGRGWWERTLEARVYNHVTIWTTLAQTAKTGQNVVYDFYDTDVEGQDFHYTLSSANVAGWYFTLPNDHYLVRVKGPTWLSRSWNIDLTGGDQTWYTTLLNGDCDNNNSVNIVDYSILSDAFNTVPGQAAYDVRADLDGNNAVNIIDYSILSDNFNQVGY